MAHLVPLLIAVVALSACGTTRPAEDSRELVVLVHGMGRTPLSMVPMDIGLRRAGYRVLNVGYDSGASGVAEIAEGIGAEVEAALEDQPAPRVHFVGHSLGTVVIRWLLVHDPPEAAGRAVLLAPPNQGSHEADRWAGLVRWTFPPITELRTTGGTAVDLGAPRGVEVAVIAASRDGKVAVAETCLKGAAHAVVPSAHTFVMMRPRVIGMVRTFLAGGALPGASEEACTGVLGAEVP